MNPKDNYSSLIFTDHFVGGYGGINEKGLAIGMTLVAEYTEKWVPGVRMNISTRWILDTCKNTKEAITFLEKIPHIRAHTFLIADKENNLARVETSAEEVALTTTKNGFDCHYESLSSFSNGKIW